MTDHLTPNNEFATSRDANDYAGTVEFLKDPFWTENPQVLLQHNRLIEFVPTKDMTRKEQLNALARFFVYLGFVFILYTGDTWGIYVSIFGMAFTLFLFKTGKVFRGKTPEQVADQDVEIQHKKKVFTTDIDQQRGEKNIQGCTAPTRNNPFMNILTTEQMDNPVRPPACSYQSVKDDIDNNFYYNLYQDVGDAVFNKNNSQRQFFTMPYTTIPNDQTSFANWLYGIPAGSVCKEDQSNCYRNHDLRANRPIVGDSEYIV